MLLSWTYRGGKRTFTVFSVVARVCHSLRQSTNDRIALNESLVLICVSAIMPFIASIQEKFSPIVPVAIHLGISEHFRLERAIFYRIRTSLVVAIEQCGKADWVQSSSQRNKTELNFIGNNRTRKLHEGFLFHPLLAYAEYVNVNSIIR